MKIIKRLGVIISAAVICLSTVSGACISAEDVSEAGISQVRSSGVTGDANGDGVLNVRDAAYIAKMTAQGKGNALPSKADYNGDGTVNIRDAAAIARALTRKDTPSFEASPEWVAELKEAQTADQLFVVAGVGNTTAYISMHQKNADGKWEQIISTPGYIGKHGLGKTKEGDGMTPVGTYGFNYAFGISDDPGCSIEYHKVTDSDYWSGDPREGYGYNQMVNISDLPDLNKDDSEHIVDYQNEYQYCLNISYNDKCEPGLGSAIFLHCLGAIKPYTGGCVAIPMDKMKTVMQNVDKDCVVVIGSMKELCPELWKKLGL